MKNKSLNDSKSILKKWKIRKEGTDILTSHTTLFNKPKQRHTKASRFRDIPNEPIRIEKHHWKSLRRITSLHNWDTRLYDRRHPVFYVSRVRQIEHMIKTREDCRPKNYTTWSRQRSGHPPWSLILDRTGTHRSIVDLSRRGHRTHPPSPQVRPYVTPEALHPTPDVIEKKDPSVFTLDKGIVRGQRPKYWKSRISMSMTENRKSVSY